MLEEANGQKAEEQKLLKAASQNTAVLTSDLFAGRRRMAEGAVVSPLLAEHVANLAAANSETLLAAAKAAGKKRRRAPRRLRDVFGRSRPRKSESQPLTTVRCHLGALRALRSGPFQWGSAVCSTGPRRRAWAFCPGSRFQAVCHLCSTFARLHHLRR